MTGASRDAARGKKGAARADGTLPAVAELDALALLRGYLGTGSSGVTVHEMVDKFFNGPASPVVHRVSMRLGCHPPYSPPKGISDEAEARREFVSKRQGPLSEVVALLLRGKASVELFEIHYKNNPSCAKIVITEQIGERTVVTVPEFTNQEFAKEYAGVFNGKRSGPKPIQRVIELQLWPS